MRNLMTKKQKEIFASLVIIAALWILVSASLAVIVWAIGYRGLFAFLASIATINIICKMWEFTKIIWNA